MTQYSPLQRFLAIDWNAPKPRLVIRVCSRCGQVGEIEGQYNDYSLRCRCGVVDITRIMRQLAHSRQEFDTVRVDPFDQQKNEGGKHGRVI